MPAFAVCVMMPMISYVFTDQHLDIWHISIIPYKYLVKHKLLWLFCATTLILESMIEKFFGIWDAIYSGLLRRYWQCLYEILYDMIWYDILLFIQFILTDRVAPAH